MFLRLLKNLRRRVHPRPGGPPQRIGFLHLGWLGDYLLFAPTIRAVRAVCPQAHITLFTAANYATVEALLPGVDTVIPIAQPRGQTVFSLWRLLRRQRLDALMINYEFDLPAAALSLALMASGIPLRVGTARNRLRALALHRPLPDQRHDSQTYLAQVFYRLALAFFEAFELPPPAQGIARFRHTPHACLPLPAGMALADGSPRLLIHPGTSRRSRQENWGKSWPPAHWAELIRQFLARYPSGSVTLTGGPEDRQELLRIERALAAGPEFPGGRVANVYGRLTTAPALAALMQACDVFVGCDSFAMHLALYAAVPLVGIFGLTSERRFLPPITPNSRHRAAVREDLACRPCLCITREEACSIPVCLDVPVSQVMAHITALLSRRHVGQAPRPGLLTRRAPAISAQPVASRSPQDAL